MINYYLVIEKRLGDYNLIDINKLDICDRFYPNDIASIDSFTSKYTEEEIIESIKRGNLSQEYYLDGHLMIVSDYKHHLDVLTKDKYNIIKKFQNSNVEISQEFKNKLYGSFKKIIDKSFNDIGFKKVILDKFNESLKSGNREEIFKKLEELPYENIRPFYVAIYKELTVN